MASLNDEKVLSYWNQAVSGFDAIYSGEKSAFGRFLDRSLRRDMYERFEWTLRHAGDLSGKSVCDLGCGTGRYVIAFAKTGARRVLGIDAASNMVQQAKSLIEQERLGDRVEVREMGILDFSTTEMFDISCAIGVFDYTRDPMPFLQRIRKITQSSFLVTFPRLWTYRMPLRRIRLGFLGCPVYFYTAKQVETLLTNAGFSCRLIQRVGKIYCVLAVPN